METANLVARLQGLLVSALRPLLTGTPCISLLDRPGYANPGDTAIWLGALRICAQLGYPRPAYACDQSTYSREALARVPGTILITGGGNLGDLWESHQLFREKVLKEFPDRPIVQLPQSIHFCSTSSLQRAREAFGRHPCFTLLVRDRRSLEIALNEFHVPTLLCPDMSFGIGSLQRSPSVRPVLWISRRDKESPGAVQPAGILEPCDYLFDGPTLPERGYLGLAAAVTCSRTALSWTHPMLSSIYDGLAVKRLERACRFLSSGEVVITNRLHGHILSLLLGIPHCISDNSYGKLQSFYETWTRESPLAMWCEDEAEAVRRAWETLGALPRSTALRGEP